MGLRFNDEDALTNCTVEVGIKMIIKAERCQGQKVQVIMMALHKVISLGKSRMIVLRPFGIQFPINFFP